MQYVPSLIPITRLFKMQTVGSETVQKRASRVQTKRTGPFLHSPSVLQPKKLMAGFRSFSPIYNLNNWKKKYFMLRMEEYDNVERWKNNK